MSYRCPSKAGCVKLNYEQFVQMLKEDSGASQYANNYPRFDGYIPLCIVYGEKDACQGYCKTKCVYENTPITIDIFVNGINGGGSTY